MAVPAWLVVTSYIEVINTDSKGTTPAITLTLTITLRRIIIE